MRMLFSFAGALLVALALFALMVMLVTPPRDDSMADEELVRVSFVRAVGDTRSENREREQRQAPERPQPLEPVPQPKAVTAQPRPTPEVNLDINIPSLPTSIQLSSAPTLEGLSAAKVAAAPTPAPAAALPAAQAAPSLSEEVTPLVDIAPNYPRRALAAGIEGEVTLVFTITADGRVANLRVVDANPVGVFEREARRAASRYRFAPRRENGQAVTREATKTLYFRLEERR
jgi:protein TonB